MSRRVYLASGTECEVLAEHEGRLWLVAADGSWGPGTIAADAVTDEPNRPEWWSQRDQERGQLSVTWNRADNRFHVYAQKPSAYGARADIHPRDALGLALFLLRHTGADDGE